jgi:hypothetical protein
VAQQQGACKAATNHTRSEVKVANVLIPIPNRDFDPTEVAVSWSVLQRLGHSVVFATPDGRMGRADDLMLTGQGLDLWGFIPGLRRFTAVGRLMRANAPARAAYAAMEQDAAFKAPLAWRDVRRGDFDGLLLPGGHRARGMREYLESEILQQLVGEFLPPACRSPPSATASCLPREAPPPMAGIRSCSAGGPPRSPGRSSARDGRPGASFASGIRTTTAPTMTGQASPRATCRCSRK